MKVAILYNKLFDHNGQNQTVGGIQTYVLNLARLCQENNMETTIFQFSNLPFEIEANGLKIRGIHVCHLPLKRRNLALYRAVEKQMDLNENILVFGADHVSVPTKNPRHIAIQHGISWDLPMHYMTSRKIATYGWAAQILKWREIRMYKRYFENCLNTVCVDYNFLNWYRTTQTAEIKGHNVSVIPNFALTAPIEMVKGRYYSNKNIRVLFARRFVEMRGTRIVGEVAKYLLDKYSQVGFTFAGEGPEEGRLREMFGSESRVSIIKYLPEESIQIHLQHDIAVVPSIASEGTSLSVLEAMATGCPVVATATGGVTNIIIHGYNGILVMPDTSSLIDGLEMLIQNSELRENIGLKGYDTANVAFSLSRWKKAWLDVLTRVGK
jgi:glycosyltransferase involved in cell wall biosynthesis